MADLINYGEETFLPMLAKWSALKREQKKKLKDK